MTKLRNEGQNQLHQFPRSFPVASP